MVKIVAYYLYEPALTVESVEFAVAADDDETIVGSGAPVTKLATAAN